MSFSFIQFFQYVLTFWFSCLKIARSFSAKNSVKNDYHLLIIRKTKRFAIPERAVYFLKTKRTAGGTPPPQNIFDRLTPVFT